MEHSYFQERLSAFADKELTSEEQAKLAEHLRDCGECRKRLNELEALSQVTSRHSVLDDSDYWEKAAQKIEERLDTPAPEITEVTPMQRRQSSGLWWKVPAIAASVVLVGYIGLHESDILREAKPEKPDRTQRSMDVTPPKELADQANLPDTAVVAEESDAELPQPVKTLNIRGGRGAEIETDEEEQAVEVESAVDEAEGDDYRPFMAQETVDVSDTGYQPSTAEDRDENYRRRSRPQAAVGLAKTDPSEPKAEVDELFGLDLSTMTDTLQMDDWRLCRDSILSAIQQLPPVSAKLRMSVNMRGFLAEGEKDTAEKAGDAVEPVTRIELEKGLLEAWYQICLLSDDPAEKSEGVAFLDSVAKDTGSLSRTFADSLSQVLKQQ